MTRLQALVCYLEGWLDYQPWPETWTGGLERRSSTPGPAPSRRMVCPSCDGSGRRWGGWRCESCQGRGCYAVDEYTGEPVATTETTWRQLLDTWVACSACAGERRDCSRCHGTGRERALLGGKVRVDLGRETQVRQGDSLLDALADGVRRRSASVSGRRIDEGMRELRRLDPLAHSLIVGCLVLGLQPVRSLPAGLRVRLLVGLLALDRVVGPVVLPVELVAAARARDRQRMLVVGRRLAGTARLRRDEEIRRLWETGGWSQEALGRKFAVSQATVSRALGRRREGEAA